MLPKIRKLDIIAVYPAKSLYFGKKWAVVAYELTGGIVGFLDVALPKDCDDIHPIATAAMLSTISRGTFAQKTKADYVPAAA